MQQPELGKNLTALRKEKNLTQEELVEKSHVSVRTIQRIEAGEVLPRMSTVKILLEALGESFESFSNKPTQVMEPQNTLPSVSRNTLLIAALAGAVYLVTEIILQTMDIAWFVGNQEWGFSLNAIYIGLTVAMITAFVLFARGFIALGTLFENSLLKATSYMLVVAVAGVGILDITSVLMGEVESLWPAYAAAAVLFGALCIAFGVSLIRLQDSMGEVSRIAGVLEILTGCLLVTVVLFFIAAITMIPAVVVEILVLYRGYEYLSKPGPAQVSAA
jgi:transcriptional regulator with XRE-family HTH domain